MSKIVVFGIMIADTVADVESFPAAGETIIGRSVNTYLGGKGFNQCVAVKRLGGDAEMVGCIGNDGNGRLFLETLRSEQIAHGRVRISEKLPTGIAQIQVDASGQNKIVVIPSSGLEYGLAELEQDWGVFEDAQVCVLQLEMLHSVTFAAVNAAAQKGVKVIFNPAPAAAIPQEILCKVDYLVPNEVELSLITGIDTTTEGGVKDASKALLAMGVKNVVTTLGGRGAMIANSDGIRAVPPFRVEKVVDTVAAGDSFIGALAVRLTEGATLDEAVLFANAMGSLTTQVKGALPSLHRRENVDKLVKTYIPHC